MSLASEERKRRILALLHESGKVVASDLAKRFDVSSETVRRDLDDLQKENKLKKVYGGAVRSEPNREPSILERELLYAEAKRQIGYLASQLIADHDVIVLDEGSTVAQIIPFLTNKHHLTIMTNSIPALLMLLEQQKRGAFDGKVILIGGEVNPLHLRVSGPIAERTMDDFYVNKSFISIDGITLNEGITSYDYEKAAFTRKLMQRSDSVIVMADYSKVGQRTVAKIADLSGLDAVISEQPEPDDWTAALQQLEVEWISPQEQRGN